MRVAVTGASGRLGGQIIDLLAADGCDVVAVCRREPASRSGVTHAHADYTDVDSMRGAFDGADTLVFVSSDGETHQLLRHHHNVVRAAASSGVGHVVVLSSLDSDLDSPFCYAATNRQTELLLDASGMSVSVARASIFTEFFRHWLTDDPERREIRLPAADGSISLVSRSDVGRAMAALALTGPTGRSHDLTGPEALDLDAIAAEASTAYGATIRYVDIDPGTYVADMAAEREDPWWAYAYASMFASIREHRWERTSDEIELLTGRTPIALGDVLSDRARG